MKPARVIPWGAMTPEQQGEHLLHFHDIRDYPTMPTWLHIVEHLRPSSWKTLPHTHNKER